MPILLAIFPLLGKLIHKLLLRPIFNKYVRKALSTVFRPVWHKVGRPVWQRTGAPIWRKIWHEAPQKEKVKKQFDAVSHCPNCDHFAMTRIERVSSNRVLLGFIPGPAVGVSRLRSVCSYCSHIRAVRHVPDLEPTEAVVLEADGADPAVVVEAGQPTTVSDVASG